MILCVDLAARFSAACLTDNSGSLVGQWHSWQSSPFQWACALACEFSTLPVSCDPLMVIEDLPHGLGISRTVRDVYRLQGMIIQQVKNYHDENRIVFIPPMLWQSSFKPLGVKPGDKKAIKAAAEEKYGYTPPQLLHKDLHGIDRQHARKTMEDYVDAFMISRYMLEVGQEHGSVAQAIEVIPRLERYSNYAS